MAKSFLMMKSSMSSSLFLHHLAHAFATFRITDGDEIDACRKLPNGKDFLILKIVPPPLGLPCVAMRHTGELCVIVLVIVFYFLLWVFHSKRSELGMVGGGGCRLGASCQSPSFPWLAEQVEPTLLIDHLQIELLAAVVFRIHPHGIVHHVGRHVVAPRPYSSYIVDRNRPIGWFVAVCLSKTGTIGKRPSGWIRRHSTAA